MKYIYIRIYRKVVHMISVILCNSIFFFLIFPSLIVFDQSSWPSRHFRGSKSFGSSKRLTRAPVLGSHSQISTPQHARSYEESKWDWFSASQNFGTPQNDQQNHLKFWKWVMWIFFLGSGDAWLNWRFQREHKAGRTEMPSTSDPFPYMVPPFWDLKYLRLKRK